MPNTILTVQEIAREALLRLRSNMVMAGLVHTNYANEFKQKGDTIQVKKPATFVADEFSSTINLQDVGESNVLVSLDKIADVSVELSSKELTLNIDDFGMQILDGATLAIAEKIDQDLCGLYVDVPFYDGASGTTPTALSNIAGPMKVLNENKVPAANRKAVWDPTAQASLVVLDAIAGLDKSGTTAALREASMGRIMGFDNYMDQNIKTHTAGAYTALADVTVTATKGDATITVASTAGVSTAVLKKGDIFTLDGYQYVVTADTAAAVAGDIASVAIYPTIQADVTSGAVTFADVSAGGHVASLGFHRNAFSLVSRPMEPPMGGASSYVATAPDGLSLRVVMGYNMTSKKNTISIDCLYGVQTLYPELSCRILG